MFYISRIGKPVPEWLQKIENNVHTCGALLFGNVSLIWKWNDTFYMLPLLPNRPGFWIIGYEQVTVTGQGNGVMMFGGLFSAVKHLFSKA